MLLLPPPPGSSGKWDRILLGVLTWSRPFGTGGNVGISMDRGITGENLPQLLLEGKLRVLLGLFQAFSQGWLCPLGLV